MGQCQYNGAALKFDDNLIYLLTTTIYQSTTQKRLAILHLMGLYFNIPIHKNKSIQTYKAMCEYHQ